MKISLVVNPAAGHVPAVDDVVALLAEAGHSVVHRAGQDDRQSLLQDPGDLIVAAGGDGTVREVALVATEAGRPFAVLPFGTANNVAKTLGVVGDAHRVIDAWRPDAARPFDLGGVEGVGPFVESVGGGLFAELLRRGTEIEESTSLTGRETDRALSVLAELAHAAAPRPWGVEIDGRDCSGDYLAVEALNIRFAGPNVPIAPAADPGDGRLDVVLIGEADRDALVRYLEGRLALSSGILPLLRVERGANVRLDPPPDVPLRIDDDPLEASGRLAVRCRPGTASVVGSALR